MKARASLARVTLCPVCGGSDLRPFFTLDASPAHQNLVYQTRVEAQAAARGSVVLALCSRCGFIANVAFAPELLDYSPSYENTQSVSEIFRRYTEELAAHLINRYQLRHKTVIEVGCGKGDFLRLLCRRGDNTGIGFDPSYVPVDLDPEERVTFVRDFYSDRYVDYRADFVCSRHVLEHIQFPAVVIETIRRSIGDRRGVPLFIEVPSVTWILREATFWDVFYEHCSYFSPQSLGRLLDASGFDVVRASDAFGGQYLWMEARSGDGRESRHCGPNEELLRLVTSFDTRCQERKASVVKAVDDRVTRGQTSVLWGAGAKGVTLLNTLGLGTTAIPFVVDINPRKQGAFIPGTAQEIVPPSALVDVKPDVVFLTNPNYVEEITRTVTELGVGAEVVCL